MSVFLPRPDSDVWLMKERPSSIGETEATQRKTEWTQCIEGQAFVVFKGQGYEAKGRVNGRNWERGERGRERIYFPAMWKSNLAIFMVIFSLARFGCPREGSLTALAPLVVLFRGLQGKEEQNWARERVYPAKRKSNLLIYMILLLVVRVSGKWGKKLDCTNPTHKLNVAQSFCLRKSHP